MKLLTLNLGLIVLFTATSARVVGEETAVFKNDGDYMAADDTFLVNGAAFSGGMSNFGKCATIEVNEQTRIGLMRFDVSSLFKKYSEIKSVTLRLFSKNAPPEGGIAVHRLNIANSAWREGGNCGGTVLGGNRHEATWFHLADYGGFPAAPPSWASRTAGPTTAGVDYEEQSLGSKENSESKANEKFDVEFGGDLNALIDDWALATTVPGCNDRGGNPCWTADWNWAQPAAETANEGMLLRGLNGTTHVFHSSEAEDPGLRPQLIITYVPRGGGPALKIISLKRDPTAGEATLSWASRHGGIYAVDFSDDLKMWDEFDDGIPSGGGSTSYIDTGLDGIRWRFYRVREVIP